MKAGDKVTYVTNYNKERGIIKSIPDDQYAFVVYRCDNKWDEFYNYTASRTDINDLILGWE